MANKTPYSVKAIYSKIKTIKPITQSSLEELYINDGVEYFCGDLKSLKNKFKAVTGVNIDHKSKKEYRVYPSDFSRNKVVYRNLRLALYLAYKYYIKSNKKEEFDDIFQTATEALMRAAKNYIPNDKAKFTTYASKCIENKLIDMLFKKKKIKKVNYEEFLDEALFKIDYLDSIVKRSEEDYTCAKSMLSDANIEIKKYNHDQLLLGNPQGFKLRVNRKKYLESCSLTLNKILYSIKKQLNFILKTEDMDLVNLSINYTNNEDYYINSLKNKIYMIKIYLKIEKQLQTKDNNILPTDEELLCALNNELKRENSIKYKIRSKQISSKFNSKILNYFDEYDYNYIINLMDPDARKEETESLLKDGKEISSNLNKIYKKISTKKEIKDISDFSSEELLLFSEMENYYYYTNETALADKNLPELFDWKNEEYKAKAIQERNNQIHNFNYIQEVLRKKIILAMLEEKITKGTDLTNETYARIALSVRKNYLNNKIKEHNEKIFLENRSLIEIREIYKTGLQYFRMLSTNQFNEIKKDAIALYHSDHKLFLTDERHVKQAKIDYDDPTGVEAIINIFFEEYKNIILTLPSEQSQIIDKSYDENGYALEKQKEIATSLGIKDIAVSNQKKKAIQTLRNNSFLSNYYNE